MPYLSKLGLMALGVRTVLADFPTCLSFGVDFQNGGSYFQNSLSSDNFTFVSQFERMFNASALTSFVLVAHIHRLSE